MANDWNADASFGGNHGRRRRILARGPATPRFAATAFLALGDGSDHRPWLGLRRSGESPVQRGSGTRRWIPNASAIRCSGIRSGGRERDRELPLAEDMPARWRLRASMNVFSLRDRTRRPARRVRPLVSREIAPEDAASVHAPPWRFRRERAPRLESCDDERAPPFAVPGTHDAGGTLRAPLALRRSRRCQRRGGGGDAEKPVPGFQCTVNARRDAHQRSSTFGPIAMSARTPGDGRPMRWANWEGGRRARSRQFNAASGPGPRWPRRE